MGNNKNILLTAFCNSSAEVLLQDIKSYKTLFLPNDKIKDSQILIDVIASKNFDYIISFGQRPNIKDKVHIETTAKDGDYHIHTDFDCEKLYHLFAQKGMVSKISHNAGTSYCNQLYLNGLKYISANHLDTKMVFIHIPYEKNITEFDGFSRKIFEVITGIE